MFIAAKITFVAQKEYKQTKKKYKNKDHELGLFLLTDFETSDYSILKVLYLKKWLLFSLNEWEFFERNFWNFVECRRLSIGNCVQPVLLSKIYLYFAIENGFKNQKIFHLCDEKWWQLNKKKWWHENSWCLHLNWKKKYHNRFKWKGKRCLDEKICLIFFSKKSWYNY